MQLQHTYCLPRVWLHFQPPRPPLKTVDLHWMWVGGADLLHCKKKRRGKTPSPKVPLPARGIEWLQLYSEQERWKLRENIPKQFQLTVQLPFFLGCPWIAMKMSMQTQ